MSPFRVRSTRCRGGRSSPSGSPGRRSCRTRRRAAGSSATSRRLSSGGSHSPSPGKESRAENHLVHDANPSQSQLVFGEGSWIDRRHKPDFRDASRLGFAAQMKVRLAARCTPPPLAAGKCPPLTILRDEMEDERKVAWVPSPPFSDLDRRQIHPTKPIPSISCLLHVTGVWRRASSHTCGQVLG